MEEIWGNSPWGANVAVALTQGPGLPHHEIRSRKLRLEIPIRSQKDSLCLYDTALTSPDDCQVKIGYQVEKEERINSVMKARKELNLESGTILHGIIGKIGCQNQLNGNKVI